MSTSRSAAKELPEVTISEARGVRYLHLGTPWIQGAMRIARPWALELEYTREMVLALLLRAQPRWPARVLLVGLGTGSLLKFLYRNYPRAKLDEYIEHRLERERKVIEALGAGARTRDELLDTAWSDVPFDRAPVLRIAAGVTLDAHLEKLRDEGRLPDGVELAG